MRTSLRSEPVQPVNLFAFLDIVFTATGVLMVIGVFFSLSPRLEKITREPEASADTIARRQELQSAIATWRQNEALERRVKQFAAKKPAGLALGPTPDVSPASLNPDALLLDESALALKNVPLSQQIIELELATARRLAAASKAEKTWLQEEQSLLEKQKRTRRLLVRFDQSPSLKEVVLLVVARDWIDVQQLERPDLRLRTAAPWADEAQASLLARFAPSRQRFLLFFKPSGAAYFETMRAALKAAGFEVGSEPLPEDYSVALHEKEAPIEVIR